MDWNSVWVLILWFLAHLAWRNIFLLLVFSQERFEFTQDLKKRKIKDDDLDGNCEQKDAYEELKYPADPHHDAVFLHKSLEKHEVVEHLGRYVYPHHHYD